MSKSYKTNILFHTMGTDFAYQNAYKDFKNIDKLLKYFDEHPEFNMDLFYSTPDEYINAINKEDVNWPINEYDFFPYED